MLKYLLVGVLAVALAFTSPTPVGFASEALLDYQTVVANEFMPRVNAALGQIQAALVAAGVPAGAITISMPDTIDLRWQIIARRGNKTLTAYVELTDGTHIGLGPGQAIFTLWVDGNGTELTHDFVAGPPRSYMTSVGLEELLAKLAELEANIPALAVKARTWITQ